MNTERKLMEIKGIDSIPLSFEPSYMAISSDEILIKKANSNEAKLLDITGRIHSTLIIPNEGRKNSAVVALGINKSFIYAGDGNHRVIYLKRHSSEKFDSISTSYNYSKAIFTNGRFVLQYSGIGKFKDKLRFANCTLDGRVTEIPTLNNYFDKIEHSGTTRSGFLTSNGNLNFFVSYFTNDILAFDNNGKIIFNKEAIYTVRKPETISEGNFSTVGTSVITTSSVVADNENLYILSNIGDKNYKGRRLVDLYSAKNGSYLKSFVAPLNNGSLPLDIYTDSKFIYFTYNGNIKKINKSEFN